MAISTTAAILAFLSFSQALPVPTSYGFPNLALLVEDLLSFAGVRGR